MVTSTRFPYQDARGLSRSFSAARPVSRSQVHLTSAAVKGLPSCHLTPLRKRKVSAVFASSHDHSVARSGRIVSLLDCGTCWSYSRRLLNTPIIGMTAEIVDSSWID